VIGIVNRGSDLTDKADGVMYTSDGRDVEMSVASTKAFYAQVAAGALLSCAIAEAAGPATPAVGTSCSTSLRELPDAMREVLARRERDRRRGRLAPAKRYWAVVGNGPNKVAAEEVRIKLSELCYKSIACDSTEDKKHIDLSSEPLILVCAAGLVGSTADDVAKEVAIFTPTRRRRSSSPTTARPATPRRDDRGARRRPGARIRAVGDGRAPVRLRGGARHRRVGASAARGPRDDRAARRRAAVRRRRARGRCATELRSRSPTVPRRLRSGTYDGHLEASTATRLRAVARRPVGPSGRAVPAQSGKVGTPAR
jgi:glucosamine--fructose-6-phosphate aminotransferase (isomerizing)